MGPINVFDLGGWTHSMKYCKEAFQFEIWYFKPIEGLFNTPSGAKNPAKAIIVRNS